jgi:DNA-binding NtrC family response regulator
MQEVYDEVRRVAPTDATVLVTGETGTGKELVARAIHQLSPRSGGPFVPVNCAALAEGVLESELFGHRKGAFTGAVSSREGLFRAAHGGTLFLDEVGDLPASAQTRLLRAIQEREVVPVGDTRPVKVDVRLVAATNRDLRADVDASRFREDLFFRLHVYQVELPPLRERRGDLPLLAEYAVRERSGGGRAPTLSPLALRLLMAHPWPGNVRELFSALESALIRCDGSIVEAQHLPREIRESRRRGRPGRGGEASSPDAPEEGDPDRYRHRGSEREERDAIVRALRQAGGVRTRAAALLGMSRTTLWRKMKEYGIEETEGSPE